jgi:hypothetical protein
MNAHTCGRFVPSLLACLLALAPRANADCPFEVVGQWGGTSWSVLADGNLVFTGIGPQLAVLDISDPAAPRRIASLFLSDQLYEIHRRGNHLFIANGAGGLQIVDIADPAAPRRVAALQGQFVRSIAFAGSYAYLLGDNLRVVDISNPAAPTPLGQTLSFQDVPYRAFVQLAVADSGYAYVATGYTGLFIFDVRNPASPTLVSSNMSLGAISAVSIVDGRLILPHDHYIGIFDISAPLAPALLGSLDVTYDTYFMHVSNGVACLSQVGPGPILVDVSNFSAPILLSTLDTNAYAGGMSFDADQLFIASLDGGIFVFDVSDPAQPRDVSQFLESTGSVTTVAVIGDFAYVTTTRGPLRVLDVSAPEAPVQVAAGGAANISSSSRVSEGRDRLYFAQFGSGDVRLVDISDPVDPIGTEWDNGLMNVRAMAIGDYFGYVVGQGFALDMMTVRLPSSGAPQPVGGCSLSQNAVAAAVQDSDDNEDFLFVATSSGLSVVDVHVFFNPTEVATLHVPAVADIAVFGNVAYLATYGLIQTVDISDPLNPRDIGNAGPGAGRIKVDSRYAATTARNEFRLLDPLYITHPSAVARMHTNGDTSDFAIEGDLAFLADGDGGLLIVRLPQATDLNFDGRVDTADLARLLSNFGGSATARWQGDLDEDGDVDLQDLAGLLARFGQACE